MIARFFARGLHRRVFAFLLAALLLAVPACDSDDEPQNDLSIVDGSYEAQQFLFDANSTDDFNVDLLDELEEAPTLGIFAKDGDFFIRYELADDDQSSSSSLRGSVTRRDDELRFDVQNGDAGDLLFPTGEGTDFRMQIEDNGARIIAGSDGNGIELEAVDLRDYGVGQSSIDGKLTVRFEPE